MSTIPSEPTDHIKRLARYGISFVSIAERTNVPIAMLKKWDRDGKIDKPHNSKGRYYCNHDFFHTIDTEAKAYWLGFLAADGCLVGAGRYRGVNLLLAGYEKDHLELYRKSLEAEHPLEVRLEKIRKDGIVIREQLTAKVRISSPIMYADLADKGLHPRKSKSLKFPTPDQVPDHLIHHFMRGYFDGDGSINNCVVHGKYDLWSFSVISSDAFCQRFGEILMERAGTTKIELKPHPTGEGMSYLSHRQIGNVNRVRDFLYRDATIFLRRKWETYQKVPVKYYGHMVDEMEATLGERMGQTPVFDAAQIASVYGSRLATAQKFCKLALDKGLIVRHHSRGYHYFYVLASHSKTQPTK